MKQTPCIATNLRRAAAAVTSVYNARLVPSGLNVTMLRLLDVIDKEPEATISELAEFLGIERSTMGRNVRVLAQKRLVQLSGGKDERSRTAVISDKGQAALAAAIPLWAKAQEEMAEKLGTNKDHFLNLLAALQELDD